MTSAAPPGRLIGQGRAADVYEIDDDKVLRRYRIEADVADEAKLMSYLHSAGFPVPCIYSAEGTDMIMARVRGIDLLSDLAKHPWRAVAYGAILARMHDQLHEIEAPPWLRRPLGEGNRIMHLDLHPGNVMLTQDGPVVIDWSNGSAGPPGADVAMAYLIMRTSEVGDLVSPLIRTIAGLVRGQVIRRFEASVSADPGPYLAPVARLRLTDRNTRPSEAAKLQQIIDRHGVGT
ncbi:MAG TPA: aminoglycoside phosphotransferase family protein [Streptosporangiaceae bacterium]|nr:aminoglycoside phosphotransferase family protein [Streptosporangiaceae bacterium]